MGSVSEPPSVERRFRMDDGVELVGDAWGAPDRRPALLLHGGAQTRHAWNRTAAVPAGTPIEVCLCPLSYFYPAARLPSLSLSIIARDRVSANEAHVI
jgi:hypothetical protein